MERALREMATAWKREANSLRDRYAQEALARLCETHAAELLSAIDEEQNAVLTLAEAADWSGYSRSHLRYLARSGVYTNVGRKGSPRFRRGDLRRKPGQWTPTAPPSPPQCPSLTQTPSDSPGAAARAAIAKLKRRAG